MIPINNVESIPDIEKLDNNGALNIYLNGKLIVSTKLKLGKIDKFITCKNWKNVYGK
ncbi:hypothetical protein BN424_2343 [Carnobacterium maltaromaticum LMA28]|uniref:Uncharacterized protein n=1 Tax=Carnobacterium maltaromaticum LMA28 TaxID=1234679 RepID=K8E548_CARML|nr:hypothetical protein BN424_2343 [Carnobacterium maltaromaticum LMA28]